MCCVSFAYYHSRKWTFILTAMFLVGMLVYRRGRGRCCCHGYPAENVTYFVISVSKVYNPKRNNHKVLIVNMKPGDLRLNLYSLQYTALIKTDCAYYSGDMQMITFSGA